MRRGVTGFTVMMAGWIALVARHASAQGGIFTGMQAGVESVFSSVTTTITFVSGGVTKTDTTTTYPTFTLNLNTLLYPGLRLSTGGVFEINAATSRSGGLAARSRTTRNRPYFLLRSTNPVLSPGFGYFRREAVDRSPGLAGTKLVNDEYSAYLGWKPDGGPRSDLQFLKTHTFDGGRVSQDVRRTFGSLVSAHRYRNLGLYYRGAYLGTDDRIARLETRQVSHGIRGDYTQSFLRKRLLWNAMYNASRQDLRTKAHGTGGEVALAVTPFAGLAAISDTPVTAKLSANGPLIDANVTASAGINLGLPATPADDALRNMGLDLLTPTEVNRIWLWVDRELPFEIASTFSWRIYSSQDNITWRREATVAVAPFGTFENRFEIDFDGVVARYIKVVTAPLTAVVPDAARFRDIFVTEIQAFVRRPAAEVSGRVVQNRYLLNTDVRLRLVDAPALYYEGLYLANGVLGADATTDTLSNGISMTHAFSRVLSVYARGAREQGRQVTGDRVATLSSATVTVEPASTFRTSFLYSGQSERVAGLPYRRVGLFVQNAARPYRGVDVLFGFGWTSMTSETGGVSRDRLLNVGATVVPRERVSLTVTYDARTTRSSGAPTGIPFARERRSYASLAIDPVRTLHVVVGGEVIAATGRRTRTTLDIGTSWAAFPDGSLQFLLAYNEALRALEFGKDRSTLVAVRWNVSRKSYIDVSYQRTRSANAFFTSESRMLSARVRLFL